MGLFSGGNSSSSSQTTNYDFDTTTTTEIQRDSGFQDSGGVLAQSGDRNLTSIEVLDAGAVNSAFDFAKESQANFGENFESVLGLTEESFRANYAFAENVGERAVAGQRIVADAINTSQANQLTSGASSLILPAMFVAGGVALAYVVFR